MPAGVELKRRLENDEQPIAKRLRLAQIVLGCSFFPASEKEQIVLRWYCAGLHERHRLLSLQTCLNKELNFKNISAETREHVFNVLSGLVHKHGRDTEAIENTENVIILNCCLRLLETQSLSNHFQQNSSQYFKMLHSVLTNIYSMTKNASKDAETYDALTRKALIILYNFIKSFSKKTDLVETFIDTEMLNIILELSHSPKVSFKALNICQLILFPSSTLNIYKNYSAALLRGLSLSSLISEKGEVLRPVVKIMDILMKYSNENQDVRFLSNFIKLFIYSSKSDDSLTFMFIIILAKRLGLQQDYIKIHSDVDSIEFEDHTRKQLFLDTLKYLHENGVNLNVKYSDVTTNEVVTPKMRKDFISFLQEILKNLLFKEESLDVNSLLIINQVIVLDPDILEANISETLSELVVTKKQPLSEYAILYNAVLISILDVQYKLSRGPEFLPKILPAFKYKLESMDESQLKYILKEKKLLEDGNDASKASKKILILEDVFPQTFCERFGKLTSELMSWKSIEIFQLLISSLEVYAISRLTEGVTSPSVIILAESLCALLCAFLDHSKMAEDSVPETVVKNFAEVFHSFSSQLLAKFGEAILQLSYEKRLMLAFLKVCLSYRQLGLLLSSYQPRYESTRDGSMTTHLSCLSDKQWKNLFKIVKKHNDSVCIDTMNSLILQKITTENMLSTIAQPSQILDTMKFDNMWSSILQNDFNSNILLANLNLSEMRMLATKIVEITQSEDMHDLDNSSATILKNENVSNNKDLLSAILLECIRSVWIFYDKPKIVNKFSSIYEASAVDNFDFKSYYSENIREKINEYMDTMGDCNVFKNSKNTIKIFHAVDLMNEIPVEHLKESCQLSGIFTILLLKLTLSMNKQKDDLKVILDDIETKCEFVLLKIFELSRKSSNVFDMFSPEFLFKSREKAFFELTNFSNRKFSIAYNILKHIFEGCVSKHESKYFHQIVTSLEEPCELLVAQQSDLPHAKLVDDSFQVALVLFTTLASFKKTNLPSEIKGLIAITLCRLSELIFNVFESVKWKAIDSKRKEDEKMETDDIINDNGTNLEKDTVSLACLNSLEAFTIIYKKVYEQSNDGKIKKMREALHFFTDTALSALLNPGISIHHARGASQLINNILHHHTPPADDVLKRSLHSSVAILRVCSGNTSGPWAAIAASTVDNVRLVCDVCQPAFFTQVLIKELRDLNKLPELNVNTKDSSEAVKMCSVTRPLCQALLGVDLKTGSKIDARSSLVKDMCSDLYSWLRGFSDLPETEDTKEEDEGYSEPVETKITKTISKENVQIMSVYFEVMTEIVSTKKMTLPRSVIDTLIQMPCVVNFDVQTCQDFGSVESLEMFRTTFEKCMSLINALLLYRSQFLQDRWPSFQQVYRKMLKCLTIRSHAQKVVSRDELDILVSMALRMERLTQLMVKDQKQDLSRIAPYLVADIVEMFQKVPVHPSVKFHLQNCVYTLLQLLDPHAIGFLMRNLTDSSRIMFQHIYNTYNNYYKFKGSS